LLLEDSLEEKDEQQQDNQYENYRAYADVHLRTSFSAYILRLRKSGSCQFREGIREKEITIGPERGRATCWSMRRLVRARR
jgi:hypothetical protein